MKLINRSIIKDIKQQIIKGKTVILIGSRQVGKTSILKLLMTDFAKKNPANSLFYFDLEKEDTLENFLSYKTLIDWLKLQGADLKKDLYLFIDEFHLAPNPNKLLKVLSDHYPNFHIVVTGSSSIKLTEKIKESLAGRKRVFKIWPLNFEEFLNFKQSPLKDVYGRLKKQNLSTPKTVADDLIKEWEEFLIFGAYPAVVLANGQDEKVKEIEDIYSSYIQKDIKAFLRLENVAAYNKLIQIMATQIGNLFNLHTTSKIVGIARETLEKYAFILENTFIIELLSPFFTNKQREIVKMNKIFFIDPGMRNFALKDFKPLDLRREAGSLAENGCFAEIRKNACILDDLHFWRTQAKSEVDFVLEEQGQVIPIEVKYQNFNSVKIPSPLKAFIKTYKCKRAFILNKNFTGKVSFNGCEIKFLPVYLAAALLA